MKKHIIMMVILLLMITITGCQSKEEANENVNGISVVYDNSDERTMQEISNEKKPNKILIAYFSLTDGIPDGADAVTYATPRAGNTEAAAFQIKSITGGDLFAIKTEENYPVKHQECSGIANKELKEDARPQLTTHIENIDDYDLIFIGFPIWWYQEPMAVRTFLEEYDFTGKTIIPFCTSLGAGIGESEKNIKKLCPASNVLGGITLNNGKNNYSEQITQWLTELDITT